MCLFLDGFLCSQSGQTTWIFCFHLPSAKMSMPLYLAFFSHFLLVVILLCLDYSVTAQSQYPTSRWVQSSPKSLPVLTFYSSEERQGRRGNLPGQSQGEKFSVPLILYINNCAWLCFQERGLRKAFNRGDYRLLLSCSLSSFLLLTLLICGVMWADKQSSGSILLLG